MIDEKDKYKIIPIETDGQDASGWLEPNGKFWDVSRASGHGPFAYWWFRQNERGEPDDPEEELQKMGWIRITNGTVIVPKKMTGDQNNKIYDWIISLGPEKTVNFYDNGYEQYNAKQFVEKFADDSLIGRLPMKRDRINAYVSQILKLHAGLLAGSDQYEIHALRSYAEKILKELQ